MLYSIFFSRRVGRQAWRASRHLSVRVDSGERVVACVYDYSDGTRRFAECARLFLCFSSFPCCVYVGVGVSVSELVVAQVSVL